MRDDAHNEYQLARKISGETGYLEGFVTASWGLADILAVERKYAESLERYRDALKGAIALGKTSHCATLYRNIAEVYIDVGNYPDAKKYAELSKSAASGVREDFNYFYTLFTYLKIAIIEDDCEGFEKTTSDLLRIVKRGTSCAILVELLVLLIVAFIDRGYPLERAKYWQFLEEAEKAINKGHFAMVLRRESFMALLQNPLTYTSLGDEEIGAFREIVLHCDAYRHA